MKNTFTKMSIRLMALLLIIMAAPQMNAQVKTLFDRNNKPAETYFAERMAKREKAPNTRDTEPLPSQAQRDSIGMKCAEVLIGGTDIVSGRLIDASLVLGVAAQVTTFGPAQDELHNIVPAEHYNDLLFGDDSEGIFISSGYAEYGLITRTGRNNDNLGQGGVTDPYLYEEIGKYNINESVSLEIKFEAKISGTLMFDYILASSEMDQTVSDPFALFVRDLGTSEAPEENDYQNVAFMPSELSGVIGGWNDSVIVEIKRLQEIVNAGLPNQSDYLTVNKDNGYQFLTNTGFNVFTTIYQAKFVAKKNHIYQIRITTADLSDNIYDTGVYLRAKSLCVKPEPPQVFGFKIDSVFYYEPGQTVIPAHLETNVPGTIYLMNKQCEKQSDFDNPDNQLVSPITIDENLAGDAEMPAKEGAYYAYLKTVEGEFSLPNPFWIAPSQPTELITITFDANGGKFADYDDKDTLMRSQIKYTFTKEPDFRPLYNDLDIFNRWCVNEEGTTPYKFGSRIEEDITLYASYGGWDITYDGMGGSIYNNGSYSSKVVKKCNGFNYSFPEGQYYNMYIFKGWYLEDTYETKITDGEQVKIFGAHTLYAKWEKDPAYWRKVTYTSTEGGTMKVIDYYGSMVHPSGDLLYYYGDYYAVAEPAEHYEFERFVVTGYGAGEYNYNPIYFYPYGGDMHFVAHFVGAPYEITVTSSDESVGTVAGGGEYRYGKNVTLTATETNPDYHFLGWALASNPESIISTANPYVFKCEGDASYIGVFGNEVGVNIEASPDYGGVVTIKDENGVILDEYQRQHLSYGTVVTIEAQTYDEWMFAGWINKNTGKGFSGKAIYTFEVKSIYNLKARFTDQFIWIKVKK